MTGVSRQPADRSTAAAVEILDCTLRDGSYSVDFKFTEETIRAVLAGLENSGIGLVELGHGLGLNAGEALSRPSLVTDERCFAIAAETLRRTDWGMFCIPGLAEPAHLTRAAEAGMGFVRIGVDITDVSPAGEFVELAKRSGLRTFVNLMKTNVLGENGVVEAVRRCAGFGADSVYLVDSVGGYLPHEVAELFCRVGGEVSVPLGFHGHDNLGLANANALAAATAGARYVDTTLDGIGRGAGNTVTEAFAAILTRHQNGIAYDYQALAQLSETVVRPLPRLHDDRTFQVLGGLTQTHSSFFPLIMRCAEAASIDVFELMTAVAEVERVRPTEALVKEIAVGLRP
jgi:4-hydroxy 2-oxovalerate aldolase